MNLREGTRRLALLLGVVGRFLVDLLRISSCNLLWSREHATTDSSNSRIRML